MCVYVWTYVDMCACVYMYGFKNTYTHMHTYKSEKNSIFPFEYKHSKIVETIFGH
jgi:hypothetical protein